MEDALRAISRWLNQISRKGLNPCSNGRCSASYQRRDDISSQRVLILVLMEDALRVATSIDFNKDVRIVLILVLMEDALRVWGSILPHAQCECLNPCSNGRCSARTAKLQRTVLCFRSLNPCSNGRCSARVLKFDVIAWLTSVLILVLMEDALREEQSLGSAPLFRS